MAQATRPAGFYRQHDGTHDALVCDGVPLTAIAAAVGTPLYVYSAAVLREAMSSLPDTLRTAVLMRDIQELSYQEIADKLRLPEGTVKSRINRGRTELARQIRKLRGDDFGQKGMMLKRTGAN